jgi:ribulose-5-phosphate 4-epimerase/fuculose-1-phosphate aldolase
MNNQVYPNYGFQTFYVTKEICNCPLIPEIIKVIRKLKTIELLKDISEISVSMKYGKRMLINVKNSNNFEINTEDFLEIVDYNPFKKLLLVMGSKEPRMETPVHWIIHNARDEVKAIIQIDDKQIAKKMENIIPKTEVEYPNGTLEQAKEILLKLRDSTKVVIKNHGVIFVGNSLKIVEDLLENACEELK